MIDVMWQINQSCRVVSVLTSTPHSNVAVSHVWISFVIWLYLRNTNQNITIKVCHAYLKNNILAICLTTVISLFTYILLELVEKYGYVFQWASECFILLQLGTNGQNVFQRQCKCQRYLRYCKSQRSAHSIASSKLVRVGKTGLWIWKWVVLYYC